MNMDKNKREKVDSVLKIIFIIAMIMASYLIGEDRGINEGYDKGYTKGQNYTKDTAGLRMGGDKTKVEALDKAKEYDAGGDWICVNVRNMDYERAVEVCQHEAAHEIFAEILETNPDKIDEVMRVVEK